jgi:Hydrazine synthase alpha subunit middle domain/WD40-like Beta Propeller Repeat
MFASPEEFIMKQSRSTGLLAPAVVCALAGLVGCRSSAPDDLITSEATTDALVFVKTAGEETLNRSWAEGNLYKLSPISPDGAVTPITAFTGASVSDPCVSYDGERILFSMRPPGQPNRNIFEIRADGTGLRQITSGGGHDFDPLYLPDDRILFTSSRDHEMDEYNHSPAERLYTCNADGSGMERISFNQSDDFDPMVLPNGRILYTRWDHFGMFNRFPLFATNPDGTGTFHHFGPHNRNFFHAQPTPDGRIIAIESTMVNEDAGPVALLKPEQGPADPAPDGEQRHWDVLTAQVNTDGAPWAYGAFKYPFPLGVNAYVASYTLPAADDADVDYGLYTFTLTQAGAGTIEDPATLSVVDLTFLYNDPNTNEYDAQLLAAHPRPPVIESSIVRSANAGTFLAEDVFFRGTQDGQERPQRGVDPIARVAVIAARPTMAGEGNGFSANEFEKRALIGYAPVYADGSAKFDVPADTPISFATLDDHDRGFVVKRTHIYVRPGETMRCFGCHEDRTLDGTHRTNPNPIAETQPATDLNLPPDQWTIINYESDIGPIVAAKCAPCHYTKYFEVTSGLPEGGGLAGGAVMDSIAAPANLDLSEIEEEAEMGMGTFPRGYLNLCGEPLEGAPNVVSPPFPRRSELIDDVLGLGSHAGDMHPDPAGPYALTDHEKELFNLWVLLGAQYK